jgi:Ser/Thr protein kinase RdoA (MazF antagonist)
MSTKTIPLHTAASLYGIAESDLQPVTGGHFTQVYRFSRGEMNYILRLTPPGAEADVQLQRSILAWMAHLAEQGAFVPAPLVSNHGGLVEVISAPDGEWLAVAFTEAEGVLSEELPLDPWDEDLFQMLGRSIGKMHAIAHGYAPSEEVSFPDWESGGNLFSGQVRNELWLNEKQSCLLEQIRALPRSKDAYGLIHGDLHFGNFFVDVSAQKITVIDFDDCAYGWFVMDIAILLFDVLVLYSGGDRDRYGSHFLRNFMTGYQAENPLSRLWWKQLPLFLELLEINVYDRVAKFYPDDADAWVMKFMAGRQERLANDIPYMDLKLEELFD